jgi:hypothetical protein
MRKLKLLGAAALLTLVAAGVAVANEGAKADTDSVAATFQAERTKVSERTCTGGDGTYRVAHEEFKGTVTSTDPRLSGDVVLRTHSYINQTTGLGTTRGEAVLRDADGRNGVARIIAVNTSGGMLEGVLIGNVKASGDKNRGELVANFHAQFTSATKLDGSIGGGAGANTAVVQSRGCVKSENASKGEGKAQLKIAKGEVTALSATSLAVKVGDATVTFSLTDAFSQAIEKLDLKVGDKVQVSYTVKAGTVVLLKVRKVS